MVTVLEDWSTQRTSLAWQVFPNVAIRESVSLVLTYPTCRVWCVRYNNLKDQLVLSSGSDAKVVLSNASALSSDAFAAVEPPEDEQNGGENAPIADGVVATYEEHEERYASFCYHFLSLFLLRCLFFVFLCTFSLPLSLFLHYFSVSLCSFALSAGTAHSALKSFLYFSSNTISGLLLTSRMQRLCCRVECGRPVDICITLVRRPCSYLHSTTADKVWAIAILLMTVKYCFYYYFTIQ